MKKLIIASFAMAAAISAQPPSPQPGTPPAAQPGRGGRGPQAPAFVSPEVQPDRHVTFRIYAPQAQAIRVSGSDIPGNGPGTAPTKGDNGGWEATPGPPDPGPDDHNFTRALV